MTLYDTLSRSLHEFAPGAEGRELGLYVCGPTVYDDLHIGNFRTLASFDVLRRALRRGGYRVKTVMNITDIDDKMIRRAAEQGLSVGDLAARYTERFETDAAALNVELPDVMPRATDHIDGMLGLIASLVDTGHAYARPDGSVYFRARSYPGYGELSGQDLDAIRVGARVEADPDKEDPADFALWKGERPGEPAWKSPWGRGRPGWHTECATMTEAVLGLPVDIHGGGADLVFPHHENERAQVESRAGGTFVRTWVHGGLLLTGGVKASKSLGNIRSLRELRTRRDPMAIRLFFLQARYGHPLNLSEDALDAAEVALARLRDGVERVRGRLRASTLGSADTVARDTSADSGLQARLAQLEGQFDQALADDLNAPQAAGVLFVLASELSRWATDAAGSTDFLAQALATFQNLWQVLGVNVARPLADGAADEALAQRVEALLAERREARRRRDYTRADQLRQQVEALGVIVEDTPSGSRWHRNHDRPVSSALASPPSSKEVRP